MLILYFHLYFLTTLCYMELTLCVLLEKNVDEQTWKECYKNNSELTCPFIPSDIPDGIKSVRLINIDGTKYPDGTLKNGTFSSYNWGQVTSLEISAESDWESDHDTIQNFDSFCFSGLTSLRKLHVSLRSSITFTPKSLSGLSNLTLLDLSGCRRLYLENLIDGLAGSDIVPSLKGLNISLLNTFREGLKLTEKFFKIVSEKRIKELDISLIQILFLNLTSFIENCETLEYLNFSRVMISNIVHDGADRVCPQLKYVDASYVILPSSVIPDRGPHREIVSNRSLHFNINWIQVKWIYNIEHIDLSGITPKDITYILNNVTVLVSGSKQLKVKTLILRYNNFERLDMTVTMPDVTVQSLDLSYCKIRFLNPGVLSSFVMLNWFDISNNRLNEMMAEDMFLFSNFFRHLTRLLYINLSGNKLSKIPFHMFKHNSKLETIDLSNNLLSQVSFDVKNLRHIKLINLRQNMIQMLSSDSISRLNFLVVGKPGINNKTEISSLLLKDNPFSCSKCDSLPFVKWLVRSKFAIQDYAQIQCETRHSGEYININQNAVDTVERICDRPKVIAALCIGAATVVIVAVITVLLIRRRQQLKRYEINMADRCALIREGAESCEFVVFLSFSSKDDEFVNNNVIGPLNEHLQNMIGDNRDLVCEGDRNFRLGRPIHDQISELLKRSSVVIVVLSNNYSLSVHCRNEFDQAFMLEKPIVLMIKDEVDTECMTPLIRDIYDNKTRILWKRENGEYVLKTSWENVCRSIIELVNII
nr:sP-TLR5 [Cyclina sinensis]